ncbi:MAG: hypothetical protein IPL38_00190 [Rhodobacter sp.]|nr:hypothetical protein [Rhodobacter sp.]
MALGREVGTDFVYHLIEGEALDSGQDEGAQIRVGFDPGQPSGAMRGAPSGGV